MIAKELTGLLTALTVGLSATTSHAESINFDTLISGTSVTTIGPISFASNTGLSIIVSSVFNTTSGQNYLGVNDGGLEVFLPGDTVTLTFSTPVTKLSVNFITSPSSPGNAFSILGGGQSAIAGAVSASTLDDGGEVFLVELLSGTPFSVAELKSISSGLFSYNIDDITFTPVPLPPSLLLLGAGLVGGWLMGTRLGNTNKN